MSIRERMLYLLSSQYGKPYLWGAKGPDGYDCSGIHEWASTEIYGPERFPGRQTAACFWNLLPKLAKPLVGCPCFWRNSAGKVFHMATVTAVEGPYVWALGAHGGGSRTTTVEIALQQGARICQKRFKASAIAGYRMWPDISHPTEPKTPEDNEADEGRHDGEPPEDWV